LVFPAWQVKQESTLSVSLSKEITYKKITKGKLKKWYLGVAKVADLQARRRVAIQQRVLQLQVPVANLLANPNKICSCAHLISIKFFCCCIKKTLRFYLVAVLTMKWQ
jgi:hypothetical protein